MQLSHLLYAQIVAQAHSRAMDVASEFSAKHNLGVRFSLPMKEVLAINPDDAEPKMPDGYFNVFKGDGSPYAGISVNLGASKAEMHQAIEAGLNRRIEHDKDRIAEMQASIGKD